MRKTGAASRAGDRRLHAQWIARVPLLARCRWATDFFRKNRVPAAGKQCHTAGKSLCCRSNLGYLRLRHAVQEGAWLARRRFRSWLDSFFAFLNRE